MRYALLIYYTEQAPGEQNPEQQKATFDLWADYDQGLRKNGHRQAGEALQPIATATTVRLQNGKTMTTDGPFAETKEQLGGFYILECKDLDEAIDLAAKCPGANGGSVEIRPILEFTFAKPEE